MHIAVIGNGAAGNNAALTAGNLNGKVSIVSEEPYPAYSACALKYYLSGDIPRQHLFLKTIEDYSEADINTIFDKKVEGIDVKRQKINFQNGSLSYDKLVIATGAESLIPSITGIKKRGVFTFKSLEDTDKILDYPMSEAVIIGSGFIGVEIGTTLKKKGISVTLVELKERILPRAFDKKPAHIIETILKEHGIKILTEERVVQILGKAKVEGVKTGKREIRADAVILASGMIDVTICKPGLIRGFFLRKNAERQCFTAAQYLESGCFQLDFTCWKVWINRIGRPCCDGTFESDHRFFWKMSYLPLKLSLRILSPAERFCILSGQMQCFRGKLQVITVQPAQKMFLKNTGAL